MEIKKILVPLDGSPESEKAFTFGLDLAEKYDARLVLAHVVDMNEKNDGPGSGHHERLCAFGNTG